MGPIEKAFNAYCKKYPLYSREAIVDLMLKECKELNITPEIAKNLKEGKSIFMLEEKQSNSYKNNNINITEIMGGHFSTKETHKNNNYVHLSPKTHKDSSLIELDKYGNINKEQFTLKGIKERFNEKKYNIKVENNENYQWVIITDKNTGIKVREYSISDFNEPLNSGATIYTYDNEGIEKESVGVAYRKDKGIFITSTYKRENDNLCSTYTTYELDGSGNIHEVRKYEKQSKYDEYGKEVSDTYYTNGKPYQTKYENGSIHNYVVDDLVPILKNKSFWGEIKNKQAYKKALKQVNAKNVYNILVDYKNLTGRDLIGELDESGKFIFQQAMKACEFREGNRENETNYIVEKLIDDIYGLGSGNLKEDIEYLTNYNIQDVLLKYREKAKTKCQEMMKNPLIPKTVIDKLAPNEGLIEAIMGETGLKDNEKKSIMRFILIPEKDASFLGGRNFISNIHDTSAMKDIMFLGTDYICDLFDNVYTDDIKADMIVNKNNPDRLKTDIQRLVNRGKNKSDKKVSKPNGKIDIDSEQGNTGDCWLLAGLISMYKKPQGKELLESLIQVNQQTGDVTVTFKGVNKKYTIKAKEIENANYLSGGDGDIRAIELAFDKYMREMAYKNRDGYTTKDINGNSCDFMYKILLGNNTIEEPYNKSKNRDFNNPNRYYTMGVSDFKVKDFDAFKNAMINEKGEPVDMVTGHAYAIIKSDNKYVYVVNPWNSKEILRITHNKIHDLNVDLGCSSI